MRGVRCWRVSCWLRRGTRCWLRCRMGMLECGWLWLVLRVDASGGPGGCGCCSLWLWLVLCVDVADAPWGLIWLVRRVGVAGAPCG